jgi:hypothetical protein
VSRSYVRPNAVNSIRAVLAFCILANLPFWVAHLFFETGPRAYFNVDYVVVGIAALYLPFAWAVAALSVVFVMDILRTSAAFYFFSQHDLLVSAGAIRHVPVSRSTGVGASLVIAAVVLAVATIALGRAKTSRRTVTAVLGFVLLTLVGYRIWYVKNDDIVEGLALSNSNTMSLVRSAYAASKPIERKELRAVNAATDSLWNGSPVRTPGTLRRNLVIVMAESYGSYKDETWSKFLVKPFQQEAITSRYTVIQGVTPFQGSTVSAELRELCHLRSDIPTPGNDLRWMKDCLPQQWNATHETTAIHGFTGYMFDRRSWYPRLGFQKILFLPELEREGVKRCNVALDGACDDQIAELIHRKIVAAKQPQLIYWLTIDTHLPLAVTGTAPMFCGTERTSYPSDKSVCEWMNGTYNNNASIAQIAADANLPATEFLIIGDHAPPFISNSRRQLFEAGVVPFVHLVPREKP